MRFCFFGTFTVGEGYPVNRVLSAGLQRAGHVVDVCRAEAWGAFVHRALNTRNPLRMLLLGLRLLRAWLVLSVRFWRLSDKPDWTIVGYPGFLDVHLARRLSRPVALVSFISLYDTIVADRERLRPDSLMARLLLRLDRASFLAADVVLVDTKAQGRYYAELFGIELYRFVCSPVGEDDNDYRFVPPAPRGREPLQVLFFGTYVPLHGIETIIDAAHALRDEDDIHFRLIGNGQMYAEQRQRADRLGLQVDFVSHWIAPAELVQHIVSAHVCLGIFGTTAKAGRVIPYKVFDAAAVGRAIITRDSPAIREMLVDDTSALLCPAGDAPALAACLRRLRDNDALRLSLSHAAHEAYGQHGRPDAVGDNLVRALRDRPVETTA